MQISQELLKRYQAPPLISGVLKKRFGTSAKVEDLIEFLEPTEINWLLIYLPLSEEEVAKILSRLQIEDSSIIYNSFDIKDSQNTLKVDLDKTVIIKKDNRIVDNKIDNEVIDLNKTTIIKNNKVNKENIEDFNKTTIIEDRNVLNNSPEITNAPAFLPGRSITRHLPRSRAR